MGLRLCSRCVTPETHETIFFDQEGVCNVCRQQEYKQEKIDWVSTKSTLGRLCMLLICKDGHAMGGRQRSCEGKIRQSA